MEDFIHFCVQNEKNNFQLEHHNFANGRNVTGSLLLFIKYEFTLNDSNLNSPRSNPSPLPFSKRKLSQLILSILCRQLEK